MLGPPQWIRESMSACLRHRSDVSRVERWDVHVPLSGGRGVAVGATSCTGVDTGVACVSSSRRDVYVCPLSVALRSRVRVLCTCHVCKESCASCARPTSRWPAWPWGMAMAHGGGPARSGTSKRDELSLRNANPNALRRTEGSAETGEPSESERQQDSLQRQRALTTQPRAGGGAAPAARRPSRPQRRDTGTSLSLDACLTSYKLFIFIVHAPTIVFNSTWHRTAHPS